MKAHRTWSFFGWLTILALVLAFLAPFQSVQASEPAAPQNPAIRGIQPVRAGESAASLAVLAKRVGNATPTNGVALLRAKVNLPLPKVLNGVSGAGSDPAIVQSSAPVTAKMPAPIVSFDGNDNTEGVLPPDTNGDIGFDPATGKKYYFQTINSHFSIWDVTDPSAVTQVAGPTANNALWSGFGGICETNNDGDAIVLFDHLANRWLFSQFALDFSTPEFHQCIAVSKTADPTGEWYLYDYLISDHNMNDYPKFGVWPDAYYMTVNQFDANNSYHWAGGGVAAFDRDAMLAGDPNATMVYIDLGAKTTDYGGMLPADLDGAPPPDGTPGYFLEWDDSTWLDDPADTLRIWEFHPDFTTPANSTFGTDADFTPNAMVQTADVDPDMCGFARNCIPQPGGTALDAIADRLMYRLAFRVWDDGTFSMVSNHTVDADGNDHAGVHWFELSYDGTSWSMKQEGVYAPDADNRWMASIAMDKRGDMALGFSVSSTEVFPSVRYAGRLAEDPLGEMTQGEAELVAGGGSQSHSSGRWGDYSMMSVDPVDDCTFWYTQEYYAADSSADWSTRIGAFSFDVCTAAATGSLSGTVTDADTGDPIADAVVTLDDGYETHTDANGHYAFPVVVAGDRQVTVKAWGYADGNATVTVNDGEAVVQDFALAPLPMADVTLRVVDANPDAGWPLYARLYIKDTAFDAFYTDPATGEAAAVQLPVGDWDVEVHVMWPGYDDATQTIHIDSAGAVTVDLPMDANLDACNAPGYQADFREDFNEDAFPPDGWSVVDNIASGGVVWNLETAVGDGNYTGGTGHAATADSDRNNGVPYDTELRTPELDPTTMSDLTLRYLANYQEYSGNEALDLDYSTDGGTSWTNILHWTEDHGALRGTPGEAVTVDLAPLVGTSPFMLRWRYYTSESSPWDWYAQIDDVSIGGCAPVADGLVFGTATDATTGDSLAGQVDVVDATDQTAQWVNTAADSATPEMLYVIGEAAGDVDLHTANAPGGYESASATVSVPDQGAVRQDFALPAPRLHADPTDLSFTLPFAQPTDSDTVTLSNTGTGDLAQYQVIAVKGHATAFAGEAPDLDRFAMGNLSEEALKHLNDRDARYADLTMPRIEPDALAPVNPKAGEVIDSWSPALDSPWGMGVNQDDGEIWVGDLTTNKDYEYQPDGTATGHSIDLPWVGVFAADMAYNPVTHTLWQLNVGGDYCIYELDPVTHTNTGRKICPSIPGLSLRGLAYDPLTDTYLAGTWIYGGAIVRIAPSGNVIEAKIVSLPISGLAFNPSTGHLFALLRSHTDSTLGTFDVVVLDPVNDYNVIGAFNVHQPGQSSTVFAYDQAGLSASCDGTLWAVGKDAKMVYAFDSGETGWCDWRADWVSASPESGSLTAGGDTTLTVNVDLSAKAPGDYHAHLVFFALTPYRVPLVNVDATLQPAVPQNDEPEDAQPLDIPSSLTVDDTSAYTARSTDPVCGGRAAGATAWYTITPTADGGVGVDTFLSDYDTVLGVYTGRPGAFTEVACNDDADGMTQSHVGFMATAGTTYYIMVGAKNGGTGGNLHLHVASFTDVTGDAWYWPSIEAVHSEGLTTGYSDGTYRPDQALTRAEMAVFVLRALHGGDYTPPVAHSYSFNDIAGHWAANWIEEAAQEGLAEGYPDGTFKPDALATRAESTVMLLRAEHGASYTPPVASSYSFSDIAGHWAADWIEQLHTEGYANGYPDGTYRPDEMTSRAEEAAWLSRVFHLPVPTLTP